MFFGELSNITFKWFVNNYVEWLYSLLVAPPGMFIKTVSFYVTVVLHY